MIDMLKKHFTAVFFAICIAVTGGMMVSNHNDDVLTDIEDVNKVYAADITIDENECFLTDNEVELIARITIAEAEGESEYGQRLVIDTVLNRVDHEKFPDTVYDVIYQPKHFTPVWNGRLERCGVCDDICELVREEAETRTNSDVIFFRCDRYSDYGEPMFKEGGHYFSSYD